MLSQSMLVNSMRQKDSLTENGAITNSTSLDSCLDLFFLSGACRTLGEDAINKKIAQSYAQSPEKTLRIIFWAGDIRGGAGERRFFRVALKWLDSNYPKVLSSLVKKGCVEFYNRWDSLFELNTVRDDVLEHVSNGLEKGDGLLAKWMPRRGQYGGFANAFMKFAGWSPKKYRKTIVKFSKTVEQKMCQKEWGDINYAQVPSVAMNKYRKAFSRNDLARFGEYITAVQNGEQKINAGAIFPYDIYRALKRGDDAKAVDVQWNALPDYMKGSPFNRILPVCDLSGSMNGLPMDISVSLGIYLSQRNSGLFKDSFVSFSNDPKVHYLKGTFSQRVKQMEMTHVGYSTNFQAVFDLILNTALREKLPQDQMPQMILAISDMEFNTTNTRYSNPEIIEKKFKAAGYEVPLLVFWNVNAKGDKNMPVAFDKSGTAMVSGASPAVVKGLFSGTIFNPVAIMDNIIMNERYNPVVM